MTIRLELNRIAPGVEIGPHKDNVLAAWAQKKDEARARGRDLPVT